MDRGQSNTTVVADVDDHDAASLGLASLLILLFRESDADFGDRALWWAQGALHQILLLIVDVNGSSSAILCDCEATLVGLALVKWQMRLLFESATTLAE